VGKEMPSRGGDDALNRWVVVYQQYRCRIILVTAHSAIRLYTKETD
jgi:hypothetical protein